MELHRQAPDGVTSICHFRNVTLAAQNGEDVIMGLVGFLDAWNREDVSSTYDFDRGRYVAVGAVEKDTALAALHSMRVAGLLALSLDYVAVGDVGAAREAVSASRAAGAVPWTSDIGLTRLD